MNGGNPYGAVPEALKETRLTLRDLMAAHMENKVMEGRLGLEKAKAETELAMVGANIKRDEIRSLADTAHLNQAANQFTEGQAQQAHQFTLGQEQTTALHREDARQRAGEFTVSKGLQERGLDQAATAEANRNAISLKELAIRQREDQRKNETKTAAEWAQAAGISPDLLGFLGVDGKQKLTRQDAEQLHGTVQTMFKSNPALGFMANGYALRGDLTRMQEQLKDPSLLPAQAAALQKQYEAKLGQFEILDKLIMAEKAPDQTKIVESARRLWSEDPTLVTKYKNFDEFSSEIQKSITGARGVFGEDIKKMKSAIPDKDAPINTKIDEMVSTLTLLPISEVEKKRIIDKARTGNGAEKRLQILQEEMQKATKPATGSAAAGSPAAGSPAATVSALATNVSRDVSRDLRSPEVKKASDNLRSIARSLGGVFDANSRKISEVMKTRETAEAEAEKERRRKLGLE